MTVVVWLAVGAFLLWALNRAIRRTSDPGVPPSTPVYPPASTSDALLNSFFREPTNYANQPQDRVFLVVGRPADYDDWDWGRLVYYWRGSTIWIRAIIQGGTVVCVELIEPGDQTRFAEAVEVLWKRPLTDPTDFVACMSKESSASCGSPDPSVRGTCLSKVFRRASKIACTLQPNAMAKQAVNGSLAQAFQQG